MTTSPFRCYRCLRFAGVALRVVDESLQASRPQTSVHLLRRIRAAFAISPLNRLTEIRIETRLPDPDRSKLDRSKAAGSSNRADNKADNIRDRRSSLRSEHTPGGRGFSLF